jgi:uncharacterized protein YegP (UPF0339 family)
MATATKKTQVARPAKGSEPVPIEFLISKDNGGGYHWTILSSGGESLARSGVFATRDDAARAAGVVRDGAALARVGGEA